ncbi:MAG: GNAT family N-acetyltransferase, partial [Parcubacteria group bacterium]
IGFSGRSKQYFSPEIWASCSACREWEKFPACHCQPMVLSGIGCAELVLVGKDDEQTIFDAAEVYCEIWKEFPWNEDFWKVPEVILDMKQQVQKDSAVFLVAQLGQDVAGFTWGYAVRQADMQEICGSTVLNCLFDDHTSIFYIDELATAIAARGKGIGSHLAQALIGEARALGNDVFCLRTDVKAQAARTLYKELGFVDLGIQDEKYPSRTYWMLK